MPKHPASGSTVPFNDINQSYAKQSIIRLHELNIMNGTSDSLFSPAKPITRAEFLITMNRILGLEPVHSSIPAYKDVGKNDWFYPGIQASTELGLTEGKGEGTFAPFQPVTRQEAAVWFVRILNEATGSADPANSYNDDSEIAPWARSSVYAMTRLQLMEGNAGRFNPKQALTRQEVATILDRLLQNKAWSQKLSAKATPGIQIGWQYRQTDEQYKQSILDSNVNVLSPRWFFLNEDGSITDSSDASLVTWAGKKGKQVWALFGNRQNKESTHQLLSSREKSAAVITKIKNQALKVGLQGINLDFENVAPEDRAAFTSFVADLARQLHESGLILSVDVSPDFKTDWTDAFDYSALGKSADYIVLMGYDEHWSGGSAGSVASLPWLTKGLDTLLKEVPASKVIVGLPLYTRDWSVRANGSTISAEDLTISEQINRINKLGTKSKWNLEIGQYTTDYRISGTTHRIWLEDSRSLTLKYSMALDRGVAGFSYWHIGGESPEIWPALRNAEKYSAIKSQR